MTSGHNNPYLYYFYVIIIIHTRNRARGPRGTFECVFTIIIILSLSHSFSSILDVRLPWIGLFCTLHENVAEHV